MQTKSIKISDGSMLKMSPIKYFWYFLKFPPKLKSTIPKATAVDEKTPIIVSALDLPFIFTLMIKNPKSQENMSMLTVMFLIPKITPKAIPVSAECPIASEKNDILLETTLVPKIPKSGQAIKTARKAFFMKFGSSQVNGKIVFIIE